MSLPFPLRYPPTDLELSRSAQSILAGDDSVPCTTIQHFPLERTQFCPEYYKSAWDVSRDGQMLCIVAPCMHTWDEPPEDGDELQALNMWSVAPKQLLWTLELTHLETGSPTWTVSVLFAPSGVLMVGCSGCCACPHA